MIGAGEPKGIKGIVRDFLANGFCISITNRFPRFKDKDDRSSVNQCELRADIEQPAGLDVRNAVTSFIHLERVKCVSLGIDDTNLIFTSHININGKWRTFAVLDDNINGVIDGTDRIVLKAAVEKEGQLMGGEVIQCDGEWSCWNRHGDILGPIQKAYTSALKMVGLVE